MKVNKRLFRLLKAETLQDYIDRLETMYECSRIMDSRNPDRVDEINEQIKKQHFIIVPDGEYKRGWDECVQHCIEHWIPNNF